VSLTPRLDSDFPIHSGQAEKADEELTHKRQVCSVSVGVVSYMIDKAYANKLERANSLAEEYSSLLMHRQ
jgi:hypothetical protein